MCCRKQTQRQSVIPHPFSAQHATPYITDDKGAARATVSPREHDAAHALDLAGRSVKLVLHFDRVTGLEVVDVLAHGRLLDGLLLQLQKQRRCTVMPMPSDGVVSLNRRK
jgi:hypothetical protein